MLISASQKITFNQVNTLKKWKKWSPWLQTDTTMQILFSGPEAGAGATYKWLSNDKNVGKGSLSIISSAPFDSLQIVIDYGEKGKSISKFHFAMENQKTKVIWSLISDLGMNPVSRWLGLFADRMIGPDLEKGLLNLDALLQDITSNTEYEILDFEMPARVLISTRDTASPRTVSIKLSGMYKKISKFLKSRNLSPTGSPLAIFHNYTKGSFDIEACMPVASMVEVPEGLSCTVKVPQKTILFRYFGPYKYISGAYNAMQMYINDNALQVSGPVWEEYVTNPLMEPDSSKWQTNIYYPLN